MLGLRDIAPGDDVVTLWAILQQFPEAHFDDSAPRSLAGFALELRARLQAGEKVHVIELDGGPVGFIGFAMQGRVGQFRGIAFDRAVHGTGLAAAAVRCVLAIAGAAGCDKVCAFYFADNSRIDRFLGKLGAEREGLLRRQTRRGGEPVDVCAVAFYKRSF